MKKSESKNTRAPANCRNYKLLNNWELVVNKIDDEIISFTPRKSTMNAFAQEHILYGEEKRS